MTFFYYVAIISAIILAFRFTNRRKSEIINSSFILYDRGAYFVPAILRNSDNTIIMVIPYLKEETVLHPLDATISAYCDPWQFLYTDDTENSPEKNNLSDRDLKNLGISRQQYNDYLNYKPTNLYTLQYELYEFVDTIQSFDFLKLIFSGDIKIANRDYVNFNVWEQISKLLKESWKLEAKIEQCVNLIPKIENQQKIAATSKMFSRYVNKYSEFISNLRNEIKRGKQIRDEIDDLVREYLIYLELKKHDSFEAVNVTFDIKSDNKSLGLDLEDKYNDLCIDVESYFNGVEEYSKEINSLLPKSW